MAKKLLLVILPVLLLAGGAAIYHYRKDLAGSAQDSLLRTLKEKSGGECWYANVCGDLAYYDCGADGDAPAYFVNLAEKRTVGECGGVCKGAGAVRCQTECPPAGWTCDLHAVNPTDVPRLLSLNEALGKDRGLQKVLNGFAMPYPRNGAPAVAAPAPAAPKEAIFAAPGERDSGDGESAPAKE